MLDDADRKLLRVLFNLDQNQWVKPDFVKLRRLTGRTEVQLRVSMKQLVNEGIIEVRPGELRVLKA